MNCTHKHHTTPVLFVCLFICELMSITLAYSYMWFAFVWVSNGCDDILVAHYLWYLLSGSVYGTSSLFLWSIHLSTFINIGLLNKFLLLCVSFPFVLSIMFSGKNCWVLCTLCMSFCPPWQKKGWEFWGCRYPWLT